MNNETKTAAASESAISTHTPGPWTIDHVSAGEIWVMGGNSPQRTPVCMVTASGFVTDRDRADARLIAAAPDMLAALNETVLQLQYLADKFGETGTGAAVLSRVNAAIAKATRE